MNDPKPPETETLRTLRAQLSELNERSRAYGRQVWQVPFAYLAVAGVALSLSDNAIKGVEPSDLLRLIGAVGCFVTLHMILMMVGTYRAVKAMQKVETQLGLTEIAKWHCGVYMWPFVLLVVFLTILSFAAS